MGDRIFQAILSMLCAALMYLYLLKVFIIPHNTSVFEIGKNIGTTHEYEDVTVVPP